MSSCLRLCGLAACAALLGALPACGGDDDGISVPDSGSGSAGDASAGCPVEATVGPFDPLEMEAIHFTQPPADEGGEPDPSVRAISALGRIDGGDGPPADLLFIELWDGFGAFSGGQLGPGDFTIAGDETNLADCGVCIYALGDAVPGSDRIDFAKQYIATSGTVTVDAAGTRAGNDINGNFTGSLSGLTMIEIDQATGEPVSGGCETAIQSVSWDAPIQNGDMQQPPPDGDGGPAPVDAGVF
ncbi:MAG TPA: hypothetical protein VKB80_18770 [Kofleriaceae bacterium]|nr:hypothetical protein [Kofleriaceae bacterium]